MIKNNYLTIFKARRKRMPRLQESAQSGRPVFLLSAFLLFGIFLSLMTFGAIQLQAIRIPFVHAQDKGDSALEGSADPYLTAEDMQQLFDERYFYQKTPAQSFTAFLPDGPVTVKTTIDNALQKRMADLFARYRPLIAAGVVLDADTGAVLAMVNYIKNNEGRRLIPEGEANLCLNPGFPAASLIKIVTAAAVIEKKGFESSKTLPISGREHTLYKHQLGLKRQRFRARSITLENAFSRSINPYFGKLGITYLARDEFGEMAHELFFNEPLEFDLPLRRSSCFVPESDFERAELASGFNTRTTISPLHAALIAALPVNGGKMMRPYVVKRIENESGNDIYCGESEVLAAPLSSYSITQLARLMQATVKKGTARKSFRHLRRYRDYSNWVLGGKTGAINMTEEQRRCEWYAGFAAKGDTRLSVAMVMVHGELRTVKPSYVAAELIKKCFTRKSVRTVSANKKKASSG